jgi:hypothetical protein
MPAQRPHPRSKILSIGHTADVVKREPEHKPRSCRTKNEVV